MAIMATQANEKELWNAILEEYNKQAGESIRIVPIAKQIGIDAQQARQLARTWKNRGWVSFYNPNRITLLKEEPL